jgi:hypothetical protein
MIKKYLIFLLLTAFTSAGNANAGKASLDCQVNKDDGITLTLRSVTPARSIIINEIDNCNTSFIYQEDANIESNGILIAGPKELGLNANNDVYLILSNENTATLIGQIPAASEYIGNRRFRNIVQEGGLLFLESYFIGSNEIEIENITPEFIFDGELCVDDPKMVYIASLSIDQVCVKKIRATKKRQLCVVHNAKKSQLTSALACEVLSARWKIGGFK